jgi:hypothetical protein
MGSVDRHQWHISGTNKGSRPRFVAVINIAERGRRVNRWRLCEQLRAAFQVSFGSQRGSCDRPKRFGLSGSTRRNAEPRVRVTPTRPLRVAHQATGKGYPAPRYQWSLCHAVGSDHAR